MCKFLTWSELGQNFLPVQFILACVNTQTMQVFAQFAH